MRLLYILVLASGCGRFGYGVIEGGGDAGAIEAPSFGQIGVVSELSGTRFVDPDVSDDGLELLVSANGSDGNLTLFLAGRASLDASWDAPVELSVAGFTGISDGELSSDGQSIGFAGIVAGSTDLYEVARGGSATPVRIDELSTDGAAEFGLSVTADGLYGVFTREPGEIQAQAEIFETRRDSRDDPWGAPQPVAELNHDGFDGNPNISPDGLRVLFDSTRDDPDRAVYFASRRDRDAPFSTPQRIDLGGPAADPTLTADGRLLLFTSQRGSNGERVFEAIAE